MNKRTEKESVNFWNTKNQHPVIDRLLFSIENGYDKNGVIHFKFIGVDALDYFGPMDGEGGYYNPPIYEWKTWKTRKKFVSLQALQEACEKGLRARGLEFKALNLIWRQDMTANYDYTNYLSGELIL